MAITVRRIRNQIPLALATGHNALHVALVGSNVHADALQLTPGSSSEPRAPVAQLITTPAASDLPSALRVVTSCVYYLTLHVNDAQGQFPADGSGAHKTLDTTALASLAAINVPNMTTLALCIQAANSTKALYGVHLTQANVHYNNGTDTISASDATDLPTLLTLANDIRTKANLHTQRAPAGIYMVRAVQ